jgi:hypothetical protein
VLEAPKQDWDLYEKRCRDACIERLRSISPSAALDIYEDLHRLARALPGTPKERERLEAMLWREKLALRGRLRAAFVALDRMRDRRDG